nr:Trk system potassium transporter TrkA [bacterium]
MYIVIVGDGKVGATLTEYLSQEGHDVVVIDRNPKVVESMVNTFDVLGIVGNGANYDVLMEAGANKARLVIAATSSDELNILCCLMAKKIGARHSVARVRNPDYSKQLLFIKEELGLSLVVNPEMEAANEISRILRFPSAIKIDSFAKGRVELVEIRLGEGNPLLDRPIHTIHEHFREQVLVCAVQRGEEVFIPSGDFVLQLGDKIHITGSRAELSSFLKALGIYKQRIKNILIVGGGKIAFYLAWQLSDSGFNIRIIEQDEARCLELSEALPKVEVVLGDGSDQELLAEQGLSQQDAFISLTGIDEENIIMSLYAASKGVDKTITKLNRISMDMVASLGLDSVISPKTVAANRIVRYVRALQNSKGSTMQALNKLVGGKVEALEFLLSDQAPFMGVPFRELTLKPNLLVGCIIRNGKIIFPRGDDYLQVGDSVFIVTAGQIINSINDIVGQAW